jgi:hypothetical protein
VQHPHCGRLNAFHVQHRPAGVFDPQESRLRCCPAAQSQITRPSSSSSRRSLAQTPSDFRSSGSVVRIDGDQFSVSAPTTTSDSRITAWQSGRSPARAEGVGAAIASDHRNDGRP